MTARRSSRLKQRGSAFIELALMFGLILLLFLGAADFAMAIQLSMVLTDAALTGAQYGVQPGNSTNLTGIQTAATNAAQGVSGFSVTATNWCACSPGGSTVSCSSTCSGYGPPATYVQVVTSATAKALFGYPGIPASFPLKGVCVMRAQ